LRRRATRGAQHLGDRERVWPPDHSAPARDSTYGRVAVSGDTLARWRSRGSGSTASVTRHGEASCALGLLDKPQGVRVECAVRAYVVNRFAPRAMACLGAGLMAGLGLLISGCGGS